MNNFKVEIVKQAYNNYAIVKNGEFYMMENIPKYEINYMFAMILAQYQALACTTITEINATFFRGFNA